jgi:hypothetical protein
MEDSSTLWYAAGGVVAFSITVIVIVLVVRSASAGKAEAFVSALAQVLQFRKVIGGRDAACNALAVPPFSIAPGYEPIAYQGKVAGVDAAIGAVKWSPKGGSPRVTVVAAVRMPRELATKFEAVSSVWADVHPLAMAGYQHTAPFLGNGVIRSNDPDGAVRLVSRDPAMQRDVEYVVTNREGLGRVAHDNVRVVIDPSWEPVAAVEVLERIIKLVQKMAG